VRCLRLPPAAAVLSTDRSLRRYKRFDVRLHGAAARHQRAKGPRLSSVRAVCLIHSPPPPAHPSPSHPLTQERCPEGSRQLERGRVAGASRARGAGAFHARGGRGAGMVRPGGMHGAGAVGHGAAVWRARVGHGSGVGLARCGRARGGQREGAGCAWDG